MINLNINLSFITYKLNVYIVKVFQKKVFSNDKLR